MTPHIAEARRAAVHLLWAACAGGTMDEAVALMSAASELWPEQPLRVGKNSPLADSPSPKAWRNASEALERARALQEAHMGIDREKAEAAERLAGDAIAAAEQEP